MVGACISCIVNELKIRPFHKHCSKENWICLMHSFVVENSHKYPLFFLFSFFNFCPLANLCFSTSYVEISIVDLPILVMKFY